MSFSLGSGDKSSNKYSLLDHIRIRRMDLLPLRRLVDRCFLFPCRWLPVPRTDLRRWEPTPRRYRWPRRPPVIDDLRRAGEALATAGELRRATAPASGGRSRGRGCRFGWRGGTSLPG